jgi:hypothetical protein
MRQPLFHIREHVLFLVGLDEDHPVGMQAYLCERREEKIRTRQTPYDRAFRPRSDPGYEKCGCRTVDRSCPAASELVQCPIGQPASLECAIDFGNPELEASELLHHMALDRADAFPKIGYDVLADSGHRSRILCRSR